MVTQYGGIAIQFYWGNRPVYVSLFARLSRNSPRMRPSSIIRLQSSEYSSMLRRRSYFPRDLACEIYTIRSIQVSFTQLSSQKAGSRAPDQESCQWRTRITSTMRGFSVGIGSRYMPIAEERTQSTRLPRGRPIRTQAHGRGGTLATAV